MLAQNKFRILWELDHPYRKYLPSLPVLTAGALAILSVGVILALRDGSDKPNVSAAGASVPAQAAAAKVPDTALDESLCAKQAWPYIDQRCAQSVEAARGSRQVRIVTDKGTSVNVVTPEPIVEAKPKPAPAAPVVAQTDRKIGPPAAPTAAEPAPQMEKVAVAPQPQTAPAPAPQNRVPAPAQQNTAPPAASVPAPQAAPAPTPAPKVEMAAAPANPSATPEATNALAMEAAAPPKTVSVVGSTISVGPSQASAAPMAPGVEALEGVRPKTSKSARQAERAEKREAQREVRRQKAIEREIRRGGGDPEDMVASVKASPRERNTRRARNAVPDEVIAAVEEATSGRGRRGGQMVTIGSANGGQRIYLVPREQISRW